MAASKVGGLAFDVEQVGGVNCLGAEADVGVPGERLMALVKRGWFWRRRFPRPRFSLWAMLVLVTVVAIPLAYVAQRRSWNLRRLAAYELLIDKHLLREEWDVKASAPVRMSGWLARIFLDDLTPQFSQVDFRNVPKREAFGVRLTDDDLLLLRYFPEIKSIDLYNAEHLTDRGLEVVSQIKNLRRLGITGSPLVCGEFFRRLQDNTTLVGIQLHDLRAFEGKQLRIIEGLSNLTSFYVSNCPLLTNESAAEVNLPTKVSSLSVRNCPLGERTLSRWLTGRQFTFLSIDASISNMTISRLGEQPQLKTLLLENAPLRDEDFQFLKACQQLNSLHLEGMPIRGELLSWVGRAETIKHLSLNSTLLEDQYLQHLSRFRGLLNLDLSYTPIAGEGFGDVKDFVAVFSFNLNDVQLSDQGKDALASLLDRCERSIGSVEFPRNWKYSDFRRLSNASTTFLPVVNIEVTLEAEAAKTKAIEGGQEYDSQHYEWQEVDQVMRAPSFDRSPAELMAPIVRLREIAAGRNEAERQKLEELKTKNIHSMRGRSGD